MMRSKKISDIHPTNQPDFARIRAVREGERKCGFNKMGILGIFVLFMMVLSVLFSISIVLRDPPSDKVSESRIFEAKPSKDSRNESSQPYLEKLLGVDITGRSEKTTCLSRYHYAKYRKELAHEPSSYLISKLRNYEAVHRRCGIYTESYNKTIEQLKSKQATSAIDCKYIVWISFSGLGNRILTLASAYLYALLTNRVLLVDPGADMADLFCEPFPEISWFLPADFPLEVQSRSFNQQSPECFGKILKNKAGKNPNKVDLPRFVYLHLVHDYNDYDKLFFCNEQQSLLNEVPWLIMKTDNYFVPSLFLIPTFEEELHRLFPRKDTVFHFLGRYLLHPTNPVWGLITRYYQTYLSKASEKIGIQIRVFDSETGPFQHVLDQIIACTQKENLLPDLDRNQNHTLNFAQKSKAVMITSLNSGYFEKFRDMYWEHPTISGEVIEIYQPTNEEHQKTRSSKHNQKALAEMILLSLTDKLVTSSWSTFGYVAQGLGGLKPWILYKPENRTLPEPTCGRAMSIEPCFHAPPFYDCKAEAGVDTGAIVPHVRHCEDMSWGLKLVHHHFL